MKKTASKKSDKNNVQRSWTEVERAERRLLAQVKQQWLCELLEFNTNQANGVSPVVLLAPAS